MDGRSAECVGLGWAVRENGGKYEDGEGELWRQRCGR